VTALRIRMVILLLVAACWVLPLAAPLTVQYPSSILPTQHLYVISEKSLQPDEVVAVETLGGALARYQPGLVDSLLVR